MPATFPRWPVGRPSRFDVLHSGNQASKCEIMLAAEAVRLRGGLVTSSMPIGMLVGGGELRYALMDAGIPTTRYALTEDGIPVTDGRMRSTESFPVFHPDHLLEIQQELNRDLWALLRWTSDMTNPDPYEEEELKRLKAEKNRGWVVFEGHPWGVRWHDLP